MRPEQMHTVVIGAGQAGLSVGYHLKRLGLPFVILDAHQRIGDVWRERWDSLRLFTPARFDGLAGMRFPGDPNKFPTKDEMADYLEAYAERFRLPVQTATRVDCVMRRGDKYLVIAGSRQIECEHVVVAMSKFQRPAVPEFARDLDAGIVQVHSCEYRNPSQLRDGPVLVAGAGNSGAEIARELAGSHEVWMAGRNVGEIPIDIAGLPARLVLGRIIFRVVFHRVLTTGTPMGRKLRPKVLHIGGPLIRVKWAHLAALGVQRAPKVTGAKDGLPMLADGSVLDVANIVWCSGFHGGFSWIDLPVFGEDGLPIQERGVVTNEPGLYFVGLHFQYALSSTMIHGVGRDAEYVAKTIAQRTRRARAA